MDNILLNTQLFHSLFKHAGCGIIVADAAGTIIYVNGVAQRQFAWPDSEFVHKQIGQFFPADFDNRYFAWEKNVATGTVPDGDGLVVSCISNGGHELILEVSISSICLSDIDFKVYYLSDLGDKQKTEESLIRLNAELEQKVQDRSHSIAFMVEQLSDQIKETQRKESALQRANNYLTNVWNFAGAIILVYDTAGVIQFVNPAAEKALGYTAAELIGLHTATMFHEEEELQKRSEEYGELLGRPIQPDFEVFVAANALGRNIDQEWQFVRSNGTKFFVSLSITGLKDLYNNVTGYLGIAIDITEKKKSEIELLAALRKEKELNELKSRFVSMASHEFRTPLSAVLSSAYLLSRYIKAEEQPQRDKHIQNIVSSVTSLTEILNDFLSVGKIEEGNINPHFTEFDVKELIEKIIKEVNHLLKENQTITYVHDGSDTVIYLDPSMLKHIIRNLLSNAIKFSTDESVVEVHSDKTGNIFTLCIKDYGIGIPESEHGNLFNIFFRSSYATNIQGTGLGLHIVKKYVELMGGNIDFKSAIGQGAEFTIKFNSKNKLI